MKDALIMSVLAMSLERDKAIGLDGAGKFSQAVLAYRHNQTNLNAERFSKAIMCRATIKAAKDNLAKLRNDWEKGEISDEGEIELRGNQLLNIAHLAQLELDQLEGAE